MVCEHCVELRHFSLSIGPRGVSLELLADVVQILPSLASLTITVDDSVRNSPGNSLQNSGDFDVDYLVDVANKFHRDSTYLRVFNLSTSVQQYELSFVPLKYVGCLSPAADGLLLLQ